MQRSVVSFLLVLIVASAVAGQTPTASTQNQIRQSADEVSKRLDELQRGLDAQSQSIMTLQQQIKERDSEIQELRLRLNQTQGTEVDALHSSARASTASSVAQPTSEEHTTDTSLNDLAQRMSDLEQPKSIHYKGVTLTPGGFFDATGIYRTHNENADAVSTLGSIPFSGTPNASLGEFRGTGRATRMSLLAEGNISSWKASGYFEMDFDGAAPTANEIESSSFQPRSRQLWAQVESSRGFSIAAGQTWSLLTTNKSGIALRKEWVPMTIDLQYVVGYNWARQWSARVTKKFNDNLWGAVAVENPETTLSAINAPAGIFGFNTSPNSTSPGSAFTLSNTPGANGISTDVAPDFIGKLVFEPRWGHYEVKAIGRVFRDRFSERNSYTGGGGGGIAAILPITKKVDVIAEGLAGVGIGRYASGLGADVTIKPDGSILPLRTLHLMAGIEAHPGSKLDLYLYGGNEYYGRAAYLNASGQPVGYGSRINDNSGCELQTPTAAQPCQAQNRKLWEVEPGFWYRLYRGDSGTLAFGASYSYTHRNTWAGLDGQQPKGIENMVMTSFRYYIP
jgi:TolA-binding protein